MATGNGSNPQTLADLPGIGPATIERLKQSGYADLMSLAVASPSELVEACELGEPVAQKIIDAARQAVDVGGFETGDVVYKRRQQIGRITLGSKALDELLGGGLESQAVTEFAAEFGSGKTQVAHQACVNIQLPRERGGLDAQALYIDTENTFRPERIAQMSQHLGLDPEATLAKIAVARAYNSSHQMLLVEKARELAKTRPIRLLVVDSLTSHFRAEFVGRETLPNRQAKLNTHLHDLLRFGDQQNAAVLVTNQVAARPDILFGDPNRPIGGHIVAHGSTYRVYLRKGKGTKRVARLFDSPHLPEAEVVFTVDEKGVHD
ncbi:MAG TPA: DNA repair and recombination protein RadA [Candidatus Thermoplasmatota archaeon]|nr:DNA repair and recombination protein RadA [Candidatus Thermoplasmatota archaeon]